MDTTTLSAREINIIHEALDKYHSSTSDSTKLSCLWEIIEQISNPIWEKYNRLMYDMAQSATKRAKTISQLKYYRSVLASSINNFGYAANAKGESWKAIEYYEEAEKIALEIKDSSLLSQLYLSKSLTYFNLGENELSNEMDYRAIELAERIEELLVLSIAHKNQAMKLMMNDNYERALVHAEAAAKYSKLLPENPTAYPTALISLGQIYSEMGKDSIAAAYFAEALPIIAENSNPSIYNSDYLAYAEVCKNRIDHLANSGEEYQWLVDSTERILYAVLKTATGEINNYDKIRAYKNLSILNLDYGSLAQARIYADSTYFLSFKLNNLQRQHRALLIRYQVYKRLGNFKIALEMFEQYHEIDGKLENSDALRRSEQREMKLEHQFEVARDSLEVLRQKEIADKELQIKNERIKIEKRQKYFFFFGATALSFLLFFLFKKFRQVNQQKEIIEKQKLTVEEQKEEILDSIAYAKRIQTAILPPDKLIKEFLPQSFVLYKPKDIVAGDFYWLETVTGSTHSVKSEDEVIVLFAVADCTGHGVPGAMVSVVCNNALNRAVREFGLVDPGRILTKAREIVIKEFEKSEEDVKDGMDIALCSMHLRKEPESSHMLTIKYAGAHNPLWIIRKNAVEVEEIKADKQPVGKFDKSIPFQTHALTLQAGDQIYIFSDGYADQFGGEKGKKFKAKTLRTLLLENRNESMQTQMQTLEAAFEKWKGNLEQVDDVCVIGVRI